MQLQKHLLLLWLIIGSATTPCPASAADINTSAITFQWQAALQDITTSAITFQWQTALQDITTSSITFQWQNTLQDISTSAITYRWDDVLNTDQLSLPIERQVVSPGVAKQFAGTLGPPPEKSLQIISPHPNQTIFGDVPLNIMLSGFSAPPQISLAWFWYPSEQPGIPQPMIVRPALAGTSEVIPRELFPRSGSWEVRVTATLNQQPAVTESVRFVLKDHLQTNTAAHHSVQSVQHQQLNRKPAPVSARSAPIILRPAENANYSTPSPIPVTTRTDPTADALVWDIEFQQFGAAAFTAVPPRISGFHQPTGSGLRSGTITIGEPGHYRIRTRENVPTARWSSWRTFTVGTPPSPVRPVSTIPRRIQTESLPHSSIQDNPREKHAPEPTPPPAKIRTKPLPVTPRPSAPINLPR